MSALYGIYEINKLPIRFPNTNNTNATTIVNAKANVHIKAIIALFINDLFSFKLYALLIPLVTALNAEDAAHIDNTIDTPNNPVYWFSTTSTTMLDVNSKTLLGSIALSPSIICIESNLLKPIIVIKNIRKGKNDNIK